MNEETESGDLTTVPRVKVQERMYHLRMGGRSLGAISDEMNIPMDRVARMINDYAELLETAAGEDEKKQALYLETSRLDALQEAAWNAAMDGDLKAIETVLKISARRSKIMGLDLVPTQEVQVTSNTLVMGSKEEFLEALNAGRGRQEPENVIEGLVVRQEVQ